MRHRILTALLMLLALLPATVGYGQRSKASLEKQIKSLQAEIANANKLLKETSKNKEVTLNQVSLTDKKIKNRQKLINACNEQIKMLEREISRGEANIESLNGTLRKLREEYAKMVVFAYKNKSH